MARRKVKKLLRWRKTDVGKQRTIGGIIHAKVYESKEDRGEAVGIYSRLVPSREGLDSVFRILCFKTLRRS